MNIIIEYENKVKPKLPRLWKNKYNGNIAVEFYIKEASNNIIVANEIRSSEGNVLVSREDLQNNYELLPPKTRVILEQE